MPKKKINAEDKLVDLLEKLLIVELLKQGVKRNDIAKILKISSVKVSAIQKYYKKGTE